MSRNPPSAVGQRNARGRELQGGVGLTGTWEMEKEGPKTRATNPASMGTHTALDSHNLPLLFPCRTQSHPLWPDNHRQHPNAVRGSCVRGGLWALLRQALLREPVLATVLERGRVHVSSILLLVASCLSAPRASTIVVGSLLALLAAPRCGQRCSQGFWAAYLQCLSQHAGCSLSCPGIRVRQPAWEGSAGRWGWLWVRR